MAGKDAAGRPDQGGHAGTTNNDPAPEHTAHGYAEAPGGGLFPAVFVVEQYDEHAEIVTERFDSELDAWRRFGELVADPPREVAAVRLYRRDVHDDEPGELLAGWEFPTLDAFELGDRDAAVLTIYPTVGGAA